MPNRIPTPGIPTPAVRKSPASGNAPFSGTAKAVPVSRKINISGSSDMTKPSAKKTAAAPKVSVNYTSVSDFNSDKPRKSNQQSVVSQHQRSLGNIAKATAVRNASSKGMGPDAIGNKTSKVYDKTMKSFRNMPAKRGK